MNKTALMWYGGKTILAKKIISIIYRIPHLRFVEVFGGSGAIVFNKPPSDVDIYNDIHHGLYNLMKVLRDNPDAFQRAITLTPYSRAEFEACLNWQNQEDPVEKARQFFVVTQQSYGAKGKLTKGQWAYSLVSRHKMSSRVSAWLNRIDNKLPCMIQRIRELQIECLAYEDIFYKYDRNDTLFYCDPPYLPSTRHKNQYLHEMNYNDHVRLVNTLKTVKGKVILSGYDNDLYNELGWEKIDLGPQPLHTTLGGNKNKKHEIIWVKT